MSLDEQLQAHLNYIYGQDIAETVFEQLQTRLNNFRQQHPDLNESAADLNQRISQTDAILILSLIHI